MRQCILNPGSPVVKNLPSNAGGTCLIPGQRIRILHAAFLVQWKRKEKKKKNYHHADSWILQGRISGCRKGKRWTQGHHAGWWLRNPEIWSLHQARIHFSGHQSKTWVFILTLSRTKCVILAKSLNVHLAPPPPPPLSPLLTMSLWEILICKCNDSVDFGLYTVKASL